MVIRARGSTYKIDCLNWCDAEVLLNGADIEDLGDWRGLCGIGDRRMPGGTGSRGRVHGQRCGEIESAGIGPAADLRARAGYGDCAGAQGRAAEFSRECRGDGPVRRGDFYLRGHSAATEW